VDPVSEWLIEVVSRIVESLPEGSVTTYGDLASVLEMGPRQIGSIMSHHGAGLPWWRVTRSDGRLPDHLLDEARENWYAEGTPLRPDGSGIQISRCRLPLPTLQALAEAAQTRMP
jgi:methylated-DNA-protein-cysteine methyltransferase-like protein